MALPSLQAEFALKSIRMCLKIADTRGIQTIARLDKQTPSNFKGKHSSRQWLTRQLNDPYVKKAQKEDFRCRSAYKLIEIDDRYKILKPGNIVVDCGAAPGSWSQVALQRTQLKSSTAGVAVSSGHVISIDLQSIQPIEGVTIFAESDFTKTEIQSKILETLDGRLVDAVISDMAPKSTGNKQLDHDAICELCLSVLRFSTQVLQAGGHVVCKLWDGHDKPKIEAVMKRMFKTVRVVKPESSRSDSAEIFLLGMDYFLRKQK